MQETQEIWVRFLGQEDPLTDGMAIHSSIVARKIPWTEEPGKPQSVGLQRVRPDQSNWICNTHNPIVRWGRSVVLQLTQYFQEPIVSGLSSSKVLLRTPLPIGKKGKLEGPGAGWVPSLGDKNLRTPRMLWLELMCTQCLAITQLQSTMFLPGLPWWLRC